MRLRRFVYPTAAFLFLGAVLTSARAGDVAIFTGKVGWIGAPAATAQAQITVDKLTAWGIPVTWYTTNADPDWTNLAAWMTAHTNNGQVDVFVSFNIPMLIRPSRVSFNNPAVLNTPNKVGWPVRLHHAVAF